MVEGLTANSAASVRFLSERICILPKQSSGKGYHTKLSKLKTTTILFFLGLAEMCCVRQL